MSAVPTISPFRDERKLRGGADEIYERIYLAILEHRLLPGTKLAEEKMAEIFNVSRARIREVLARLAYEQIVEIIPKKGAYIAKPSVDQARDIFEARRVIEPAIMQRLARLIDPDKVKRLHQHLADEVNARERNDKRAIIRLSGEFHNLAAELAGNSAMTRSLRELATLTCLIILVYDAPTRDSCRVDEHSNIVDALVRRDGDQAAQLMLEHLDHIEHSVDLSETDGEVDLAAIFA